MCWLSKWLSNKPLTVPFPEELPDYSQTLFTVSIAKTLQEWLVKYSVPIEYYDHWRNVIVIRVTTAIPHPAQTWEEHGIRHLDVKPEWLNPGVVAHEQAHNSYALLTEGQKAAFNFAYAPLKVTDPLIKLLYSINTYGSTSNVEGHAEVYRYLGSKMPKVLKGFYPKLF